VDDPYAALARFYDRAVGADGPDLAFYLALARRTGGPVLEIGAGTGRVAVPLARAGYEVIAVEPSAAMRAEGEARAVAAGVALTWVAERAELLAPSQRRYALVLCALDTFLHFGDGPAQRAVLDRVRDLLLPDGLLVLDLPALAAWWDWQPGVRPLELLSCERDPATGQTVAHYTTFTVDPASQTRHVTQVFEETAPDGTSRKWFAHYPLRFVGRYELEFLLAQSGFALDALYGDYDLGALDAESERMIVLARRARRTA